MPFRSPLLLPLAISACNKHALAKAGDNFSIALPQTALHLREERRRRVGMAEHILKSPLRDAVAAIYENRAHVKCSIYNGIVRTVCHDFDHHFCRTVLAKISDQRLGITLAAMCQSLWRKPGGGFAIPMLMEGKPKVTTDTISWVDTSVMPCDVLTKKMKPDMLRWILDTNWWDPRQTEEAKAQKANRQQQRQTANAKKSDKNVAPLPAIAKEPSGRRHLKP